MGFADSYRNGRAIGLLVTGVVMFFVLGPLVEMCSKMPGSPNLQLGQRVMYQMAGRKNLEQVGFFEDHPDAKPSSFVDFVADPEHELWPEPYREKEQEAFGLPSEQSNRIPLPPHVVFSPKERQAPDSDEIVFSADDANRRIIIRGFSPGVAEPTFEYDWDFPTKAGKVPLP